MAVISKSFESDRNAGMCASLAHPRSGLVPMMPTRIFLVMMVTCLLCGPKDGREGVARNLPLALGLVQQEQLLVAARNLRAVGEDLHGSGRACAQHGPVRRKQFRLRNLELELDADGLEDAGVGFAHGRS